VHRTRWSGVDADNSLAGLRACYAAPVARAEIDFRSADGELVVAHDAPGGRDLFLLADALEVVRIAPSAPTLLMLDAKDEAPWPPALAERIARLIEPVRERVFVGSPADWNLRRLRAADPDVAIAFDPQYYLDRKGNRSALPGAAGAYGYHDAHPLAFRRTVPVAEYLRERLEGLCRLVPGIRELHLHLALFEEMLDDGIDVCAVVHEAGAAVDVWTLDAGTPRWRERLAGALRAGVDIVTTNTPRELSAAAREGSAMPPS
jgi:glycerophosphoryl diester phosphodiesterase